MRILFVHQNFPGQYKHLAPAMAARPGNQVVALCINKPPPVQGVKVIRYGIEKSTSDKIHPWVMDIETKVIRGEACALAAEKLRKQGFVPDVICAHPGWGESLFLKDLFPEARLLAFSEFYYALDGGDVGFDPEFPRGGWEDQCRVRMKNANHLINLELCDWAVAPTEWQKQSVTEIFRDKISVIFDGTDTDFIRPDPEATFPLPDAGITLTRADEVISYVSRNLEPYRGFHVFMRALPDILARRPEAHVLIVGGDEVSYGKALPKGQTYRQLYMDEVGARLDMSRVHFLGRLPYDRFLQMFKVSQAHIYLTYPFVLSWSMLEAMASECLVIGSATPPVEEVIRDGDNGLLVDFFSSRDLCDAIDRVFNHPDRMRDIRKRARQTVVERYDLKSVCLPRQMALIDDLAAGRLPPSTDIGLRPPATDALRRALEAKQAKVLKRGGRRR